MTSDWSFDTTIQPVTTSTDISSIAWQDGKLNIVLKEAIEISGQIKVPVKATVKKGNISTEISFDVILAEKPRIA